jgi:PBP1b-binding outer membrane lipoprotein LpoB
MKTLGRLLLLIFAVVALNGCIDADNPTPQQGSKGATERTNSQQ